MISDNATTLLAMQLAQWPREIVPGEFGVAAHFWNVCVQRSPDDSVIICTGGVIPTQLHLIEMCTLLDFGFGMVLLGGLDFFGFKKELIHRIGWFTGALSEEETIRNKLRAEDISIYSQLLCSTPLKKRVQHEYNWATTPISSLGFRSPSEFLPWKKSVLFGE